MMTSKISLGFVRFALQTRSFLSWSLSSFLLPSCHYESGGAVNDHDKS